MTSWVLALGLAKDWFGRDEFGRACALRLKPRVSVMVEDTWYHGAAEPPTSADQIFARLSGEGGGGDLELFLAGDRPRWFRFTPASATGHAHACQLVGPRNLAHRPHGAGR